MSATGLDVFEKTLQTTNIWLDQMMAELGPDRQVAWHVLGAVLRSVRDRIPLGLASHLGAQLPILIRGTYYDQWNPEAQPLKMRSRDEFIEHVTNGLQNIRPVNVPDAIKTVFGVLNAQLDEGQLRKIRDALPESVRALWQDGSGPAAEPDETPDVRKARPKPFDQREGQQKRRSAG
jgi:uncharacterized protein (DUF2267 family)